MTEKELNEIALCCGLEPSEALQRFVEALRGFVEALRPFAEAVPPAILAGELVNVRERGQHSDEVWEKAVLEPGSAGPGYVLVRRNGQKYAVPERVVERREPLA